MIDFYLASVVVFAIILAAIFYLDRKNVKRESILLIRRTKRGKEFLIKLGTRFPRFWKVLGVIGVLIGFCVSSYTFIWILDNSAKMLAAEDVGASFMLVLPTASAEPTIGPGFLGVPFWYWIIAIGLLVLVHEGLHGIMAAREKVKIKSLGWGLLAVIPLAFVEPDEEQLKKKPKWSQLRVFAAGSFANFMLAGVFLLILNGAMAGVFEPAGVGYQALIADYPAADANLTGTIIRIDDYEIKTATTLNRVLERIGPDKIITIYTLVGDEEKSFTLQTALEPEPKFKPDGGTDTVIGFEYIFPGTLDFVKRSYGFKTNDWTTTAYEISFWEYVNENHPGLQVTATQKITDLEKTLQEHPRSGFIGILNQGDESKIVDNLEAYSGIIIFISGLFFFVILINVGVGIANLLPIKPLDGGRMWEIVFQKTLPPKYARSVTKAVSIFTFLLLIANFIVPILL